MLSQSAEKYKIVYKILLPSKLNENVILKILAFYWQLFLKNKCC